MRVLLVVPGGVTVDGRGDVIPVLASFVQSLALQCRVCVLAVNDKRMATRDDAPQFTILNPGRRRWPLLGVLCDTASAQRSLISLGFDFDIVHSFWLGRPSTITWLLPARRSKPWIASVGGQELRTDRIRSLRFAARQKIRLRNRVALSRADLITAGSTGLIAEIEANGHSAMWWPLFPDTAEFSPAESISARSNGPFRIITVADHNEAKDPLTLLRTIQELRRRGHNVHLDWIGRELQPGLSMNLASRLGVADCVRILGHMAHRDIPQHLRSADLYLQSSRYESQGVSVCEAAACGLPVVGTSTGILPELSPEGAIAVQPRDSVGLANAAERVIVDPECRNELRRGATQWMSGYSLEWTVNKALETYQTLLAQAK